jgi:hypothetical protein
MSHDFRIAGRRAVAAINLFVRLCSPAPGVPSCNFDDNVKFEDKAAKAIEEADAQHDSAVDKSAVDLLRQFNAATSCPIGARIFRTRGQAASSICLSQGGSLRSHVRDLQERGGTGIRDWNPACKTRMQIAVTTRLQMTTETQMFISISDIKGIRAECAERKVRIVVPLAQRRRRFRRKSWPRISGVQFAEQSGSRARTIRVLRWSGISSVTS